MLLTDYINILKIQSLSETEKAKFLCFYHAKKENKTLFSLSDINNWFTDAGFSKPNTSRLKKKLLDSKIMKSVGNEMSFVLTTLQNLEKEHSSLFTDKKTVFSNSELIDEEKFFCKPMYGFLNCLIKQINACYNANCYDAVAVLMRRLFEILLILTYRKAEIDNEIKDSDGQYRMLDFIVKNAKNNRKLNFTRIKKHFDSFKKVGNFSAHNIYYIASVKDIDDIKQEYRVMLEELYNKAGLTE